MSGTDYTAIVDLSYTGQLSKGMCLLKQTPRGTLPSQFVMDAFGRLSVPSEGGSFTGSITVTLSRSVTAGASGTLIIRGVDSAVGTLAGSNAGHPVDVRVPLNGGGANAKATANGVRENLLKRSLELAIEFTGTGGVNFSSGSATIVLHQEEGHTCTTYDLETGFKIHRAIVLMQPATGMIGPELSWCQWCREVVITDEPDPPVLNVG